MRGVWKNAWSRKEPCWRALPFTSGALRTSRTQGRFVCHFLSCPRRAVYATPAARHLFGSFHGGTWQLGDGDEVEAERGGPTLVPPDWVRTTRDQARSSRYCSSQGTALEPATLLKAMGTSGKLGATAMNDVVDGALS